jgi:recombination protein RecA
MDESDKGQALAAVLDDLRRKHPGVTVARLGDVLMAPISVISSGMSEVDRILGVGGWPKGRVVELFGPESGALRSLALRSLAQAQKLGGVAAFIDAEHAFDVVEATALGVDTDSLLVAQPDNGEQALEITEALVRSGAVDLIVVDSVPGLVARAELEGDADVHAGLHARLMSQSLRKTTAIASRTNTIVVFINQLRPRVGLTFGNGETTTGGNALKFYATIRVDVRRLTDAGLFRVKIVKNKLAPPFRVCEVSFDVPEKVSVSMPETERAREKMPLVEARQVQELDLTARVMFDYDVNAELLGPTGAGQTAIFRAPSSHVWVLMRNTNSPPEEYEFEALVEGRRWSCLITNPKARVLALV